MSAVSPIQEAIIRVFGQPIDPARRFHILENGSIKLKISHAEHVVGMGRRVTDHLYEHLHDRFDLPNGDGLTLKLLKGIRTEVAKAIAAEGQGMPCTVGEWAQVIERFGKGDGQRLVDLGELVPDMRVNAMKWQLDRRNFPEKW